MSVVPKTTTITIAVTEMANGDVNFTLSAVQSSIMGSSAMNISAKEGWSKIVKVIDLVSNLGLDAILKASEEATRKRVESAKGLIDKNINQFG